MSVRRTRIPAGATGDAGAPGAMVRLFDQTLGSAATFDLTSISQSYYNLKLVLKLRCNTGATKGDFALITFNNDSGNNYNEQVHYGQDTTSASGKNAGVARFAPTWSAAGSALNANIFGGGFMEIFDYTAAYRKFCIGTFGTWNDVDGYGTVGNWLGQYVSNTAISRITIVPFSGTQFAIGSRVTLYGIG